MIYTVECDFTSPALEADWNRFYSDDKLPALISVAGFHTSQRFAAIEGDGPKYLAAHTIDAPEVLFSDDYRDNGGGSFAEWSPHIDRWRRNVFDGLARMPALEEGQTLLFGDANAIEQEQAPRQAWALTAVALDRAPTHCVAAIFEQGAPRPRAPGLTSYSALTPQLTPPPA